MFSVALIGADGAGKTTIARKLEAALPEQVKYLYMGINIGSSNVALPTSRLVEAFKRRKNGTAGPANPSLHARPAGPKKRSVLRASLRLLNRLAEEWYRQYLSWKYRRAGYIVIYDRHFQFDFEPAGAGQKQERLPDRLHRWLLARCYPRPDLVIFLDAPADVLYARKGEATLEYLAARRAAFLQQGRTMPNFIRVDATQSLEQVYAEVIGHIFRFRESACAQSAQPAGTGVGER